MNGNDIARDASSLPQTGPAAYSSAPAAAMLAAGSVLGMIRRDWKRFALIVIAATAIAGIIAAMQPPRYAASALATVSPRTDLTPNELLRGMEVLEHRTLVATVAAIANTPTTRDQVRPAAGHTIAAEPVPNTNLFRVEVRGDSAAQTAEIANRVPQVVDAQTRAMYKYYQVAIVSPAVAPSEPFSPQPLRAAAAGLVVGLFLGLLAAYANHRRALRRSGLS